MQRVNWTFNAVVAAAAAEGSLKLRIEVRSQPDNGHGLCRWVEKYGSSVHTLILGYNGVGLGEAFRAAAAHRPLILEQLAVCTTEEQLAAGVIGHVPVDSLRHVRIFHDPPASMLRLFNEDSLTETRSCLARLTHVKRLELSGENDEPFMPHLVGLTDLEQLEIRRLYIDRIRYLSYESLLPPQLRVLELGAGNSHKIDLTYLTALTRFKCGIIVRPDDMLPPNLVDLEVTSYGQCSVIPLSPLSHLTRLKFPVGKVDSKALAAAVVEGGSLAGLAERGGISVQVCEVWELEELKSLKKPLPIGELELVGAWANPPLLEWVGQLQQLHHLCLTQCVLWGPQRPMAARAVCRRLTSLSLVECNVTDAHVASLLQHTPSSLRNLDLSRNPGVTDACVKQLVQQGWVVDVSEWVTKNLIEEVYTLQLSKKEA